MKTVFVVLFVFTTLASSAQLAKLSPTGQQEYRINLKRGFAFVTPFSKSIRSYSVADMIENPAGGYIKFNVIKGESGDSKNGAYIHFIKLDRRLNITSEKEEFLIAEGSANAIPVGVYSTEDALNIITALPGKTTGTIDLRYWQFDLASLTLRQGNTGLTSLPINPSNEYDLNTIKLDDEKGFIMTVMEEGSKKQNAVLHCLWFDKDLKLTNKQTTALPYLSNKGQLIKTLVAANGVYCLLGYPDDKDDDVAVNSVMMFTNGKSRLVPLTDKEGALVNCAIALSATKGLLLGGMVWAGKKEYCSGLVTATISNEGKLENVHEENFPSPLLDLLSEADTKKGVKRDYYVRSISERTNGVVDVVINHCSQNSGWAGQYSRTPFTSANIYDVVVFSFDKDRLVSTIPIKRNIEQYSERGMYVITPQTFGVREVFTVGDDLYIMYFDNPGNTIGTNKKPKWVDFSKGRLTLARIDKNYKATQQELIQFEKGGEFRSFYELRTRQINDKQFILSTNQYAVFSKNVKTSSILVDIN